MTDLNSVMLVGRVTRDCDANNGCFAYLQNGTALAKFSIAVNRSRKGMNGEWEDEASFFNVTIFGKLAESLAPRLKKGVQVAVKGSLKQDRWEKDGQKFSSVGIVADSVQLFVQKQNNQGEQSNFNGNNNQQTWQNVQQQNQMQQRNFQPAQPLNNQNIGGETFLEDIPYGNGSLYGDDTIPF